MRLVALYSFFALIALAIETTLARAVPYHALIPNLIVILAVDLGLRHHGAIAVAMAFAIGYAADSVSGANLGANALLTIVVFLASYEISIRLIATTTFVGAIIVLFATPFAALGSIALSAGFGALSQAGPLVPEIAANAVITAFVAPIVFAILARCRRAIGLRADTGRK
ncbi:MAG: rod shape-determining protein MreD [Candidatus Binataceae bacterium]